MSGPRQPKRARVTVTTEVPIVDYRLPMDFSEPEDSAEETACPPLSDRFLDDASSTSEENSGDEGEFMPNGYLSDDDWDAKSIASIAYIAAGPKRRSHEVSIQISGPKNLREVLDNGYEILFICLGEETLYVSQPPTRHDFQQERFRAELRGCLGSFASKMEKNETATRLLERHNVRGSRDVRGKAVLVSAPPFVGIKKWTA